jgi:hypothetical protein
MVEKIKYYYKTFEYGVVSLYSICIDFTIKNCSAIIDRYGIKKISIFIIILTLFVPSFIVCANIYLSKLNAKYIAKYIEIDKDIDNFCASDLESIKKSIISLPSYISYHIISTCIDKSRSNLKDNSDKIIKLMNLNISTSVDKFARNLAKLQKFTFLVELGGATKKDVSMIEDIVDDKYLGEIASEILMKYNLYNGNIDAYKNDIKNHVQKYKDVSIGIIELQQAIK